KVEISQVLDAHRSYVDCEIQQRACEYYVMNNNANAKLMESVFDVMPNYSERESLLLKRIKKANKTTTDRDVWGDKDPEKAKEREEAEKKKAAKEKKENEDDDDDDSSSSESESDSSSSDSSSDSDSDSENGEKKKESKP